MKYKHSEAFYKKQYLKYNGQVNHSLFKNFDEFRESYKRAEAKGYKDITKNFVYETKYEIDYNTYVAERDMMKKIGKKVPKKELLNMTTTEFAEKYNEEIQHVYKSYLRQGKTGSEAAILISEYFFGSK